MQPYGFVELINPTDGSGNLSVMNMGSLVPFPFDSVTATYPSSTTETYTYKLGSDTVATVTVVYASSTKEVLTSVTRS
jgi:fructose-1,6-bisphosphatase